MNHPLIKTIVKLKEARGECVGEILDYYGKCDKEVDHAWRAINRLIHRIEKNQFKPYK